MRLIKFAFIGLVVLFAVATALSLLLPSQIHISRVINVRATDRRAVYDAVADLRVWKKWNDFVYRSSLTNLRLSAPSVGEGAWLRSDQLRIDEGKVDSTSILLNWALSNGKQFAGGFQFLALNEDSVTVQWWFDFHFRWYPWEKLGVFVYDRKLGPAMEESLAGLKRFVENPR